MRWPSSSSAWPTSSAGKRFYSALFGWTFTPGPSGAGSMIETPTIPGGIHGGDAGSAPYLFFRVDDLDAAVARVRELGGEVEGRDLDGDAASQRPLRPLHPVPGRPGLTVRALPTAARRGALSGGCGLPGALAPPAAR